MISFQLQDEQRMKHVEREIARTCHPYRENTEAALVIFALFRCARILLRLYPKETQEELLLVLVPFIRGENAPGASKASRFLLN
jgi:hypothetical protein